jgi:hypothetical protein
MPGACKRQSDGGFLHRLTSPLTKRGLRPSAVRLRPETREAWNIGGERSARAGVATTQVGAVERGARRSITTTTDRLCADDSFFVRIRPDSHHAVGAAKAVKRPLRSGRRMTDPRGLVAVVSFSSQAGLRREPCGPDESRRYHEESTGKRRGRKACLGTDGGPRRTRKAPEGSAAYFCAP